jgi:hypothetical protein
MKFKIKAYAYFSDGGDGSYRVTVYPTYVEALIRLKEKGWEVGNETTLYDTGIVQSVDIEIELDNNGEYKLAKIFSISTE